MSLEGPLLRRSHQLDDIDRRRRRPGSGRYGGSDRTTGASRRLDCLSVSVLFQGSDQACHVMVEVGVRADHCPIEVGQPLKARWQVLDTRHRCVAHHERDDRNTSFQRGLDLHPDEIAVDVETSLARLVGDLQPLIANHDQNHMAAVDRVQQGSAEIRPKAYVIHVLEETVLPEMRGQPVVDPSSDVVAIRATIGNEDLPQNLWAGNRKSNRP